MPCIWGRHNNSQLFVSVALLPLLPNAPGAKPDISPGDHYLGPSALANALVDTGATTTGISSRLAGKLGLQPIGKIRIHGVGGIQNHNSYLFRVAFPFALPQGEAPPLPPPSPGQVQAQIHVLGKVIQGCEFDGGSAPTFDVLLGMDVISTGLLVVQGNGSFSFSF